MLKEYNQHANLTSGLSEKIQIYWKLLSRSCKNWKKTTSAPDLKKSQTPAGVHTGTPSPWSSLVQCRGDHEAGVPESTPKGVYDFCRSRSRTRSRIFEWKPDPVSSEISDLCEISDLLLFFSYFDSQSKEIKSGNYFFDACCV